MPKAEFAKFLATLSRAIPRFAPNLQDQALVEIWYRELGKLSPEAAQLVYKRAVAKYDQFPSIRQLLDLAGLTEQSDADKGREVGERIWGAISKFGSANGTGESARRKYAEVAAYVGEIGARVIEMQGGWNQICEVANYSNAGTLKAQWRELAEVVVRKPSWDRDAPPRLDATRGRKTFPVLPPTDEDHEDDCREDL